MSLLLATETPGTRDGLAQAAAVAVAARQEDGRAPLLVALEREPRRRGATLLAAPAARQLEASLRKFGLESAVARGHLCQLALPAEPDSLAVLSELFREPELRPGPAIAYVPGPLWVEALEAGALTATGGLLSARMPRDRSLAALVVSDLHRRGMRTRVATRPLGRVAARRALTGIDPGGAASARARRIASGLLGSEAGQALPAMLGAIAVLLTAAMVLVAIGGAVTGAGRAQRSADLAAVSAVRSMRDGAPRLLAPARFANGAPNPRHLSKSSFLERAAAAARDAGRANGVAPARIRVSFPDAGEPVPLRARVRIRGDVDELPPSSDGAPAPPIPVVARATAEAAPPAGWTGLPAEASGGGYSGPLVYRQGEGMRPDVAVAFDLMAAAARKAGVSLVVTSGFRSDAEQSVLFAAHPDPTWVAPPGSSLHRCATELDLGPSSAYGWLAAQAPRFGFLKRYAWEPWHFGYVRGPPPCSEAGNSVAAGSGADGLAGGDGLPAFVPARYRGPLQRSASRWNVSAALLAAQIEAESGFNPDAVSPAGALGIAQFMPGTAASYALRDPFDPVAAIDAQAHLMSDLLRQFKSVPLALAAYNAGPGAVSGCSCIPYAETRAYVARILALLNGSGALISPPLEVRLVK